jgi:hypothetical protein
MPSPASEKHKVSYVPIIIGVVTLVLLIAGYLYLNAERSGKNTEAQATAEAKAYLGNLELSDVKMQAAENFMQQRVVEIDGRITNKGPRPLKSIDVYCLFYSTDGRMIHRERVPVVKSAGKPLAPSETREFRLPFDTLPANWNQAMPHLVIAQITFAQ